MKKIVILCLGILAELLICFADGYIQRQSARGTEPGGGDAREAISGRVDAQEGLSGGDGAQEGLSGEDGVRGTDPGEDGAREGMSGEDGARKAEFDSAGSGERIRVLIKTAGYASAYHDAVTVASAAGFTVTPCGGADSSEEDAAPGAAAAETEEAEDGNGMSRSVPAGQEETFSAGSGDFAGSGALCLTSADGKFEIRNLERERANEVYEGELEIRETDQGLLLINALPLEDYLCGVVPSEMPSSYPPEALKAQAVCARTYAKKRMREDTMLYADVDDSVSYQVYNNQDRTEEADAAVRETAGLVLEDADGLIDALYYSTSCGLDMDISLSKEEVFAAFLSEDSLTAREAEEPWYRWQTDVRLADLGDISELSVQSRLSSGAVNVLRVTGADGAQSYVEGEYSVREYLAGAGVTVTLQDGERVEQPALLPSAFFILQPLADEGGLCGYHILGGGYGHGIGMSQNGAKHMALDGCGFAEILRHYYPGAEIRG